MKTVISIGLLGLFVLPCWAESVDAPKLKAGDTWTYKSTTEKGAGGWGQSHDVFTVSRATASSVYYTSKQDSSTQPAKEWVAGADWSRRRDVNGKETVVNRPMEFPLSVGKTWHIDYTEAHPNKAHSVESFRNTYTVIGMEEIEVPAGKFNTWKIEAEGFWTAEIAPSQSVVVATKSMQGNTSAVTQIQKVAPTTATGRTYKAFWYSPDVKRFVKTEEEYYGNDGVRNERYAGELESFKLNP